LEFEAIILKIPDNFIAETCIDDSTLLITTAGRKYAECAEN